MFCPHAVIRPTLLNEAEVKNAPEGFKAKAAIGIKDYSYHLAISPLDCTGCGNCRQVCPAKEKALEMVPLEEQEHESVYWEYVQSIIPKQNPIKKNMLKGSQFEQPLLEFSGACAGCGETPYAKLVTQLFGDRMMIANATGCSSIWGASAPSIPFTTNHKGYGPAWANSLFEDNAEFGLGMLLGGNAVRNRLLEDISASIESDISQNLKTALTEWVEAFDDNEQTRAKSEKVIEILGQEKRTMTNSLLLDK